MLFLPFVLPICVWVAYSDMSRMKIPNKAVIALAVVFIVLGPFVMPSWNAYFWQIGQGVVVLIIGFLITQVRLVGAGDAKFAAAMAPYIAPQGAVFFILLFSVVLLLAFILHRIARAIPAVRNATPNWESWTHNKFPMGLALSSSLAIYLCLGAYFALTAA